MSIAPPASDSVTNRRELEFSNQILKTNRMGRIDARKDRKRPIIWVRAVMDFVVAIISEHRDLSIR
jgi:hypothetical protein